MAIQDVMRRHEERKAKRLQTPPLQDVTAPPILDESGRAPQASVQPTLQPSRDRYIPGEPGSAGFSLGTQAASEGGTIGQVGRGVVRGGTVGYAYKDEKPSTAGMVGELIGGQVPVILASLVGQGGSALAIRSANLAKAGRAAQAIRAGGQVLAGGGLGAARPAENATQRLKQAGTEAALFGTFEAVPPAVRKAIPVLEAGEPVKRSLGRLGLEAAGIGVGATGVELGSQALSGEGINVPQALQSGGTMALAHGVMGGARIASPKARLERRIKLENDAIAAEEKIARAERSGDRALYEEGLAERERVIAEQRSEAIAEEQRTSEFVNRQANREAIAEELYGPVVPPRISPELEARRMSEIPRAAEDPSILQGVRERAEARRPLVEEATRSQVLRKSSEFGPVPVIRSGEPYDPYYVRTERLTPEKFTALQPEPSKNVPLRKPPIVQPVVRVGESRLGTPVPVAEPVAPNPKTQRVAKEKIVPSRLGSEQLTVAGETPVAPLRTESTKTPEVTTQAGAAKEYVAKVAPLAGEQAYSQIAKTTRGGSNPTGYLNPERKAVDILRNRGLIRIDAERKIINTEKYVGKTIKRGWYSIDKAETDATKQLEGMVYFGDSAKDAYENARIGRGKPVHEVLKDYPDLAAKYGKTVTPQEKVLPVAGETEKVLPKEATRAEEIGKTVEAPSVQEGAQGVEEGRLRVRNVAENRMETRAGKEVTPRRQYYVKTDKGFEVAKESSKVKLNVKDFNDVEFFSRHRGQGDWTIHDAKTGYRIASGKSKLEAIENAKRTLSTNGRVKYDEIASKQESSPWYQSKQSVLKSRPGVIAPKEPILIGAWAKLRDTMANRNLLKDRATWLKERTGKERLHNLTQDEAIKILRKDFGIEYRSKPTRPETGAEEGDTLINAFIKKGLYKERRQLLKRWTGKELVKDLTPDEREVAFAEINKIKASRVARETRIRTGVKPPKRVKATPIPTEATGKPGGWLARHGITAETYKEMRKTKEGKAIAEDISRADEYGKSMSSPLEKKWYDATRGIARVTRKWLADNFKAYVESEGKMSIPKEVNKTKLETIRKSWNEISEIIAKESESQNIEGFRRVEGIGYFPHWITPEARNALMTGQGNIAKAIEEASKVKFEKSNMTFDDFRRELVKTKRFGSLENPRIADLPEFVEVNGKKIRVLKTGPEIINQYIKGATTRLGFTKVFGQEGIGSKLDARIESHVKALYPENYKLQKTEGDRIKEMFNIMQGVKPEDAQVEGWLAETGRTSWNLTRGAQLTFSAITNAVQGNVPVAAQFGLKNTIKNSFPALFGSKKIRELKNLGLIHQNVLESLSDTQDLTGLSRTIATKGLKYLGVEWANRFINKTSILSALDYFGTAARSGDGKKLAELGTLFNFDDARINRIKTERRLSAQDEARIAQKAPTKTNVMGEDPFESARFMRSGWGKYFTAYMSIVRRLGIVTGEALDKAKSGDVAPLATMVLGSLATEEAKQRLKDWILGKERKDYGIWWRMFNDITRSGFTGMIGNAAGIVGGAIQYNRTLSEELSPAALQPLEDMRAYVVAPLIKGKEPKLTKFVSRTIPLTQPIINRLEKEEPKKPELRSREKIRRSPSRKTERRGVER